MNKNRAVFLDRDGVINIEKEYAHKIEDFEFQKGVFEAAKSFCEHGYLVIVVTNQSGIARGYYTNDDFLALTEYMVGEFEKHDAKIAKVYHCPHAPEDGCGCRKPNPGMLLAAQKEFDIDMQNSWMIGDKEGDIKAALNAGVGHTVLVRSGHKIDEENTEAEFVVNGIFDIIETIK